MDIRTISTQADTTAEKLAYAANLEAEAAKAREQVAQAAQEAAERRAYERQEQDRRDALAAAQAAEAERLRLEVEAARAVSMPTGTIHSRQHQGHADGIDVTEITAAFGLVVINPGPLRLPVITCSGHVSTIEGPELLAHRLESQPFVVGTEHTIRAAFCALAVKTWADAIHAEEERAHLGDVNDAGRVLYTAALPAVKVEPLPDNPKLCRVVTTWGEVFIYRNPGL